MKFLTIIVTIFPFEAQAARLSVKYILCNFISINCDCWGAFDMTCKVITRRDVVGCKFFNENIFHIVKAFKMKNPLNFKIRIIFIVARRGGGGGGVHSWRKSFASTQEFMEAG